MTEIPNVRQVAGEWRRRWFADDYFDLIVWYEGDSIVGFQLCYDRGGMPRAYTWTKAHGGRHDGIDDGEAGFTFHKATPILTSDGALDVSGVSTRFSAASDKLPADIRDLVLARLADVVRENAT